MEISGPEEFVSIVRSHRLSQTAPDAQTLAALQQFILTIPFYHQVDLLDGLKTPGYMTYEQTLVLQAVERYVRGGDKVLDVGCRDGLFCIRAQERGALEVMALDIDPSRGFSEILAPIFDLCRVRHVVGNFLDPDVEIPSDFDVIILAGVLYHLRYPFLGIRRAADALKEGGIMILETAYLEEFGDLPILLCPVGDFSPFEPTSVSFFNRRGLSDTLASLGFKVTEVVDEFTFILSVKSRYKELPFPKPADGAERSPDQLQRQRNPTDGNIGRLVWICQKTSEMTVPWTHSRFRPELVHTYWNRTATTHSHPMWLKKRGIIPDDPPT